MKSLWQELKTRPVMSRPARGGWVEIAYVGFYDGVTVGPAPHGAGGLKWSLVNHIGKVICPAPHGAGGLKYDYDADAHEWQGPAPHGAGGLKSARRE